MENCPGMSANMSSSEPWVTNTCDTITNYWPYTDLDSHSFLNEPSSFAPLRKLNKVPCTGIFQTRLSLVHLMLVRHLEGSFSFPCLSPGSSIESADHFCKSAPLALAHPIRTPLGKPRRQMSANLLPPRRKSPLPVCFLQEWVDQSAFTVSADVLFELAPNSKKMENHEVA